MIVLRLRRRATAKHKIYKVFYRYILLRSISMLTSVINTLIIFEWHHDFAIIYSNILKKILQQIMEPREQIFEQPLQTQDFISPSDTAKDPQPLLQFPYSVNSLSSSATINKSTKVKEKRNKKEKKQRKKKKDKQNKKEKKKMNLKKYFANKYAKFLFSGLAVVIVLNTIIYAFIGEDQKFDIKLDINRQQKYLGVSLEELGLVESPQVGTHLDLYNISQMVEFARFKTEYSHKFKSDIHIWNGDTKLKEKYKQIQHIKFDSTRYQDVLRQAINKYIKDKPEIASFEKSNDLGMKSLQKQDLNLEKLKKIEKNYAQITYKIDQNHEQQGLCILVYCYLLENSQKTFYANIESIKNQNYSNYRIIFIDDHSPLNISSALDKNLRGSQNVSVLRNRQMLGKDASYFIHSKICRPEEIIVLTDSKFQLVGFQNFQIINSLFQNQSLWMFYPQYFESNDTLQVGSACPYRQLRNSHRLNTNQWQFSQLIVYRGDLISKLPTEHFFQYTKVDKNKNIYTPIFQQSKGMKLLIYSLLELCGQQRIKFVNHIFYRKEIERNEQICSIQQTLQKEYKARIKKPLKKLESLHELASYSIEWFALDQVVKKLGVYHEEHRKCIENQRRGLGNN